VTLTRCLVVLATGAALVAGCSSATSDEETSTADQTAASGRNFSTHPAIVEVETADHVYAVSDVHGQYEVFVRLLAANHLIAKAEADPTKVKWTGATATLVIAGDHIDKGPKSIAVIDLLRVLEEQAPKSGGRSIALMGNHEAEFLDDPKNDKAMSTGTDEEGIDPQLTAVGVDPRKLAAGTDKEGRGKWLANLPLGVRVKKWFFAHGGNTQRLSLTDLKKKLETSIANNGFGDKDVTGNDSILEAQQWYGNWKDGSAGQKEIDALGHAEHIVFGHDPGAFDDRGKPRQSKNGLLVKIDGAMGLHDKHSPNPGFMLHVSTKGKDFAEVLDEQGKASPLE
jgi:Calcineurin-like phosphoesterase